MSHPAMSVPVEKIAASQFLVYRAVVPVVSVKVPVNLQAVNTPLTFNFVVLTKRLATVGIKESIFHGTGTEVGATLLFLQATTIAAAGSNIITIHFDVFMQHIMWSL